MMINKIAHLGIVVKDLEKTKAFYKGALGLKCTPTTTEEGFKLSMVEVGDVHLELMEPIGTDGPTAKFLEKRGEGIHHICYETDDIEAELKTLAGKGIELVDKKSRQGIEGLVAFVHPRSSYGVLTELVQKP
jgi:methylmalonyl-CoA/ethylmalonyl-CoA epimerase